MNLSITPQTLCGHVPVPASKSIMHRALICAALSKGTSIIRRIYCSEDIEATIRCLQTLGASFEQTDDVIVVHGISSLPIHACMDCGESGSTIRFLIPLAAALGVSTTFIGQGLLVTRPLHLYQTVLDSHGSHFAYTGKLPCQVQGKLEGGRYSIRGDVSSQFITGLLFALPLLEEDSVLEVLPPFESKSYVDITLSCLQAFGICIHEMESGVYQIPGGQQYHASDYSVESDYSQAAFFLTASMLGSTLSLSEFQATSHQGDAAILDILQTIGCQLETTDGTVRLLHNGATPFHISAENIPDLVPTLCVLATCLSGISTIRRVERLKLKESDRIASTMAMITALGGRISYQEDCLSITGSALHGGTVHCENDHRIAMAAAMAATACDGIVTLLGAECVNKSYPTFWEEYQRLGGQVHVIDLDERHSNFDLR